MCIRDSCEEGTVKPEPRIYEILLERFVVESQHGYIGGYSYSRYSYTMGNVTGDVYKRQMQGRSRAYSGYGNRPECRCSS